MNNKPIDDKLLQPSINIKHEIVNKEFSVEYKGYSLIEVDQFLDWLSLYFELIEKEKNELKQKLSEQEVKNQQILLELAKIKEAFALLQEQKKNLEAKGVENVDIITRLSKLEGIVNKK